MIQNEAWACYLLTIAYQPSIIYSDIWSFFRKLPDSIFTENTVIKEPQGERRKIEDHF